jgi:hypothetical protein
MATWKNNAKNAGLALLGVLVFVVFSIILENTFGVPFDTSYRIACAGICLGFIWTIGRDYPGQRWFLIAFAIALLVNIGIFFTPLVDRPASRGELMIFALPDTVILLAARIVSYPVQDTYQRAVRQQMILGLVIAIAFCALLLFLALIPDPASS